MIYDIIVIGGGPAGLTAAVYAGRANKSVLVLEKGTFGGQITSSPKVENIPGFLAVSGNEFAEKLMEQAMELGAEIECCEAQKLIDGEVKTVVTDEGEYQGKTVIIACGTTHRLLGLPKEDELVGNGISFCAVCDGAFYEGKTVAVIGGGNSALQEAILLSDTCKQVHVVQNLDFFTGEEKLVEQLKTRENVTITLGHVVDEYLVNPDFCGIRIRSEADGSTKEIAADGLFLAVGLIPQNQAFSDVVTVDERGYITSGETCETNLAGVFVAGDCRTKFVRQVATAAADGAIAALAACRYLQ